MKLSERQIAIIGFERTAWQSELSKKDAIRQLFAISPSRYYQIRDDLIDSPEAMEYDPMVIRRLQKQRKSRRSKRLGISVAKGPIR
ncbi:MAG: DUF3263 domain-containing protein [Acidimicrobiales bacterium]|nr:DUF3263 domain-containing protein [Acidimicrobiales bacterium]MDP6299280.1 DUF3263 domain-containing protein [Acidimicrobiales bacterium]HJM28654.1 DUF3263 domain-containing protein [Acidimicrobiales bacterium]HJM97950.1 DUF3263 domain-containing protein [Acidimicrobiales bacterium]